MPNPRLISVAFAESGTKNEIPVSGASEPQQATLMTGFPNTTQKPISEGGIPPERADFNGILNLYGQHIVNLNKGLAYEFDQEFADSIGGYPLNARIMLSDGQIAQNTLAGNTNNPNSVATGWVIGIPSSIVKDASGLTQQEVNQGLNAPIDLKSVLVKNNGSRIFVKSVNAFFEYNSSLTDAENGVTIVDKWEMLTQDTYYASWFADKDVQIAQNSKLQVGYAYATKKGKPFIIDGNFWLSATSTQQTCFSILSNSVLSFVKGVGSFNLLPSASQNYQIIKCFGANNYVILNPEINGDRLTHTGTGGEWGHGLQIADGLNGYIHQPVIKNCWGDGVDMGRLNNSTYDIEPTNITIFEPVVIGCRRNGISPRSSDNCKIIRPQVSRVGDYDGVTGTFPKAGIDIEPNNAVGGGKPYHKNLIIESPIISDCYAGLYCPNHFGNQVEVSITGNSRFHNCTNTVLGVWNRYDESTGYIDLERAIITGTVYSGIQYATVATSNFKITFREIVIDSNIVSFPVRQLYNGFDAGSTSTIGNATFIFNLSENTNVNIIISADDTNYTLDSKFLTARASKKKVALYTELTTASQFPKFGANFEIDGQSSYSATAATFSRRSSKLLRVKTDTDTQIKAINTANDFSEKTIVYDPTSAITTYGIRINDLSLTIGGVAKTSALTKDIGASMTFRNVSGGQTVIIAMTGVWTFS